VAVEESFLVQRWLAERFPTINLIACRNTKEALAAVATGRAFAYIGPLRATASVISREGYRNLRATSPSSLPDGMTSMGVRSDWPELRDIIDKVLDALPASEKMAMVNRWTSVRVDYGIKPGVLLKWAMGVGLVAAVIFLLFVVWNRQLASKVEARTAEIVEREQRLRALALELTLTEEKERRRIATGLHDGPAQSLALARVELASACKALAGTAPGKRIEEASRALLESLREIRRLMLDLGSPSLNEIGLPAALSEWLEKEVGLRHNLRTSFTDACGKVPLTENARAMVFRSVRELLMNVVKHAAAENVSVKLAREGQALRVTVEDDGAGFDPEAVASTPSRQGGFGLFSIRERMADMGGTLQIVSARGGGCKAMLLVPLGGKDGQLE
jgi:signal transduction histidine kinase